MDKKGAKAERGYPGPTRGTYSTTTTTITTQVYITLFTSSLLTHGTR